MIQPNELRLGNLYIRTEDIIDTVKELTKQYIQGEEFAIPYDSAEGVPITEELLLKLGFEKKTVEKNGNTIFTNGGFIVFIGANDACYLFFNGSTLTTILKYVHRLQNIVYNLTEQELPISNEKIKIIL